MGRPAEPPSLATDAIEAAASVLLIASAFLPWVRRGPGASLKGHELVDALLSLRQALPAPAIALSVLWYAIPLCGALNLLRLGLAPARWIAIGITTVAAIGTGACAVLIWGGTGVGNGDIGFLAALLGAAVLVLLRFLPRVTNRAPSTHARILVERNGSV